MRKKILTAAAIIIIAVLLITGYFYFLPGGSTGAKKITVNVINGDSEKQFFYDTEEKFLGAVLLSEKLVTGTQGPYGLFIDSVDGYSADAGKQEWWCVTKGGESVMTGVDTTPIEDGDVFELTLTVGW